MIPAEYINQDGFVTVEPGAATVPGEGNGWLQTGLAIACDLYPYQMLGVLQRSLVECCFDISKGDVRIWRSPHKKNPGDENKCDDYWGAMWVSAWWPHDLYAYFRRNGTNCDPFNRKDAWSRWTYWFGRHPHFLPFVRISANEAYFFDWWIIALHIFIDAFFIGEASGNKKAFCRLAAVRNCSKICRIAAKFWVYRVKKQYGTVGGSWAKDVGMYHPLAYYDE